MASAHDAKDDPAYHQLFGHSRMVVELLQLHTPPELQKSLSLRGGMLSLNTRHHPTLQDKREGDRTFLVARSGEPQAVLVRLEFQSTQDADMNLRVALYNALLWQDLRTGKAIPTPLGDEASSTELPLTDPPLSSSPHSLLPILPFVIYNGEERWHGRQGASLRDRVEFGSLRGLAPLQLDANFLLIDIRHTELPREPRGPLDVLFALEQLRDDPAEASRVLKALLHILPNEPENASLREAFRRFIIGVLKARGIKLPPEAMRTLEGLVSNFANSIENYGKKVADQAAAQATAQATAQTAAQAAGLYLLTRLGRELTDAEVKRILLAIHTPQDIAPLYQLQTVQEIEAWLHPEPASIANSKPAKNARKKP